jgi:transposase
MARTFPPLRKELVEQIEKAWAEPQPEWARQRLRVVRLIAQRELTAAEIMRVADVSRQTIFTYRDTLVAKGVPGLLRRDWKGARQSVVRGAVADEFIQRLAAGQFRQARDAQAWIKKRTRQSLSESGVRKILRRLGGKLKVPRKSHAKKDPAKAASFKLE